MDAAVQGLDLAERYFAEHGAPLLEAQFANHAARIAAGLVGEGSNCFGFDDELSRDHDWGPGFCLWLAPEDHREIGARLRDALGWQYTPLAEGMQRSYAWYTRRNDP